METNEMTFGKAIKNGYKHWDDSTGKTPRKEYWYFFLFNVLIFPVKIFLYLFFMGLCVSFMKSFNQDGKWLYLILFAVWLIIDYPLFNATKRRLNDAGYLKGMVWMGLFATPPAVVHILTLTDNPVFNPYIIRVLAIFGLCALLYMLCQKSK